MPGPDCFNAQVKLLDLHCHIACQTAASRLQVSAPLRLLSKKAVALFLPNLDEMQRNAPKKCWPPIARSQPVGLETRSEITTTWLRLLANCERQFRMATVRERPA